ncbi:MAG: hypothetical protein FJY85_20855, partial [Deltaproteobacteria bacterium]|nr:hypothetical protein [Deltaproteobacteria bacterium]
VYETIYRTIEKAEVKGNEVTTRTIYFPFDEGKLRVLVRTADGLVPRQPSRIEVSASAWEKPMTRKTDQNNAYDALILPADLTYRVTAYYGTGLKPIQQDLHEVTVAPHEVTEVTIALPPFDEGKLTVLLRTESGKVLDHQAEIKILALSESGAKVLATNGVTEDAFSTYLLAGAYEVVVEYKIAKEIEQRVEQVILGAGDSIIMPITLPDLGELVVVLRTRSGRVVNRTGTLKVYDAIRKEIDSHDFEPQGDYRERLKPGSYLVVYEHGLRSAPDPAPSSVEVRANEIEEVTIELPFDEGRLAVSVVPQGDLKLAKKAIISVFDDIGRGLYADNANEYAAWLPLGRYRVKVEYGGEVRFDEVREVKLDEETRVEVLVSDK